MKKSVYLLISLLLCGCSGPKLESESIEDESTKGESITEKSETITPIDSNSQAQQYLEGKFVSIEQIYLNLNETYRLDLMAANNEYALTTKFVDGEAIELEGNTIIPIDTGDATISIVRGKYRQDVQVHVVDYEEYGSYFTSLDLGRLYGKKVVFFGDSITHNWAKYPYGDTSVVNDTTSLGYNYIPKLNDKCKFASITNAAWSGGTMATVKNGERLLYKSFSYCVEANKKAIEEADYIFIWYGTNDYTDQINIGSTSAYQDIPSSAEEVSSFAGGMKYGVNKILEYQNNAQLIFFNLLFRTYGANGTKYSIQDYNNAIQEICATYMLKCLDMYSIFDRDDFGKYSNDGLHPNDAGYQVITDFILNNGVRK